MNTRFDDFAYESTGLKCTACNNPAVIPFTGGKHFCVRCNLTLPDWMVKK